jgi:hypothetical protein
MVEISLSGSGGAPVGKLAGATRPSLLWFLFLLSEIVAFLGERGQPPDLGAGKLKIRGLTPRLADLGQ